jgi:methyl coenzyme M reductase subunit C-like uncharacterized protein (methanogenesis marker protein 7)
MQAGLQIARLRVALLLYEIRQNSTTPPSVIPGAISQGQVSRHLNEGQKQYSPTPLIVVAGCAG